MQYRLYYFLWIYFSNWQEYTNINSIFSIRYISQIDKKLRLMFEGPHAQDKNGCDPKLSNFGIGNDKTYRKEKNAISIVLFPLDIFTNWQEIMIDMLVRGDAFQVFIQATSVSLQAPGRLLNYIHTGVKTLKIVNTLQIHLFRYLTPPPQSEKKGVCLGGGGGHIPAGMITLFSIFSSTLSKVGPVFSPFSLFSLNIGLRVFGRT